MREFLKQYATYSAGLALNRLAALLLLPFYTRFLTPEEYGVLDVLMTAYMLLQPVTLLGIDTATQILYFQSGNRIEDQNNIISTSLTTVTVISLIFIVTGLYSAELVSQLLLTNLTYVSAVRLFSLLLLIDNLLKLFQDLLRLRQKARIYNYIAITQVILVSLINFVLLGIFQYGIGGYIVGLLIGNTTVMIIAGVTVLRYHPFRPSYSQLGNLLRLGLPLVPVSFAYWVLSSSDRFFLARFATLSNIGVYGIAYRLASGISIFTTAIQLGWRPYALRIQALPSARQTYVDIFIRFLAISGWLGIVICAFSPIILQLLVSPAFYSASAFLPFLVLTQIAYAAYFILNTGLEITQKTSRLTWIVGTSMIINLTLNFLLIPIYKVMGAAIATVISYMFAAIIVGITSQKFYPLPYNARPLISLVCLLIAGYSLLTVTLYWLPERIELLNFVIVIVFTSILLYLLRFEIMALMQKFSIHKQRKAV